MCLELSFWFELTASSLTCSQVQDIEAETLTGFLNGIEWILEEVESKHAK